MRDLGVSKATAYRYLSTVKKSGYITEKKGVVYVKSKRKLFPGKRQIKFNEEQMADLHSFKQHIYEQAALIKQNSFRYINKQNKLNSGGNTEPIETFDYNSLPRDMIGASLSKISEYLNVPKTTIAKFLKEKGQKQKVFINKFTRGEFYKHFGRNFKSKVYYFVCRNNNYYMYLKIASVYNTVSRSYYT